MSSKRVKLYKGRLDCRQITDGINCARRNAIRLAEDAQILLDNQRYASAVSLAILSLEESGKEYILRNIAVATSDDEVLILWHDYIRHTKKNDLLLMPHWVMYGALYLENVQHLFRFDDASNKLDELKQKSIYTSCYDKDLAWSEPSSVIDKGLAVKLVHISKMPLKDEEVKVQEIELLIKYLKGIRAKDIAEQKEALSNYLDEMLDLELLPKGVDFEHMMRWLGILNH